MERDGTKEDKKWTTKDELLYLKKIGRTLNMKALKVSEKDMLKGYIEGIRKRVNVDNDGEKLNIQACIKQANIMLALLG